MQPVCIFGQALVDCLAKPKYTLDDQKRMFDLGANRRFSFFDLPLPVDKVLRNLLNAPHSPVDTILYFRQMSIPCYFISFLKPQITCIAVNDLSVLKPGRNSKVVSRCKVKTAKSVIRGRFAGADQSQRSVNAVESSDSLGSSGE